MADVDLLVAVQTAGVPSAIAELRKLREAGLSTSDGFVQLAASSVRASGNISRGLSSADSSMKKFKDGVTATKGEAVSLNRQLQILESTYSKMGKTQVGATARERLTAAGGAGGLVAGVAAARQVGALRESRNADPVSDDRTVLREDAQMLDARTRRLGAMANVERATWEESLRGMTSVERASARLARAQTELTAANKAVNQSFIQQRGAGGRFLPFTTEQLQGQTSALNQQAVSVRNLSAANGELARATENANEHGNAFQSSFSFFIIAGIASQVTQVIIGMGAAAITASSEIERSFADVERTFEGTSNQLASLQDRLRALATETPVSVVDLAEIATLGNQLGVAASDIQGFTTTIAQYTAVSGQSAEDAATAFGRISNLTGLAASQYSNLASAITYVARTTVATESSIQNTAKEITALASGAGFSADSIVGLAGALSSLAIPPERARGALSLYFGALNSAVAEGGPKLAAFSELTRLTSDQLQEMVTNNRGQEVFTAFISGLSQLDTVAKTTALDTLGLSTIRVDQTMRALAQNVPLVTSSFEGASKAFAENTEIATQYAIIQETLASKIIEFQNAIQLASGAVGDALAPALKDLLGVVVDTLVAFTEFADSPVGKVVIQTAGAVTALVLVMSTLIGAAALVKASLIVIPWALTGLGATSANSGIIRFIAGMVGMNLTTQGAVVSQTKLSGALIATGATSRAAAAGFLVMRGALIATGIGAAVVLVGTLVAMLDGAGRAAKITAQDMVGLGDAIKTDTATFEETGKAIATFSVNAAGTTDEQAAAAAASRNWANVLGNDLVAGAEAAAEAVGKIAAGDTVIEQFRQAIGANDSVKSIISDSKFAAQWTGLGFDMTKLIEAGISDGESGVNSYVGEMLKKAGISMEAPAGVIKSRFDQMFDAEGNDATEFVNNLLAVGAAAGGSSDLMQEAANSTEVLYSGLKAIDAEPLGNGFRGATESLTAFQDNLSSGLGKFVSFGDALQRVKDAMGEDADLSLIDPNAFGAELAAANSRAVTFFQGISELAASGRTEFASQLAALGPEAQSVLTNALKLDGASQAAIEAEARFAGFLASDAFKKAYQASMTEDFNAYSTIFSATGDLSDVQSYIAAQVGGVGEAWERQWAIDHPNLPLNVTPSLINPSPSDLAFYSKTLSGQITITPNVVLPGNPQGLGGTTYNDTISGAKIVLPADLDGAALSDSLAFWSANQNATPEEIASMLNTETFSANIEAWRKAHGDIKINVRLVPANSIMVPTSVIPIPIQKAKGGLAEQPPGFARGSGYKVRGAGSGTSDSILARLSAGEFVNTADSTKFWGPDFFDSLNRKMLPTSFLNMLGAAAVSGNRGPERVTHVSVVQNNPLTRDPLKQLREDSEMIAAGIW